MARMQSPTETFSPGCASGALIARIEISAGVDLRKAVAVVLDLVVGAEQAARQRAAPRECARRFRADGPPRTRPASPGRCSSGRRARRSSHIGLELLLVGNRVGAVEVRIVEVRPLDAPHLVVHLRPLRLGIDAHLEHPEKLSAPSPGFTGCVGRHDRPTTADRRRRRLAVRPRLPSASSIFLPSAESSKPPHARRAFRSCVLPASSGSACAAPSKRADGGCPTK